MQANQRRQVLLRRHWALVLENIDLVKQNAERVATTVQSKYMPIGNLLA